jgi:hypothetical protein
MAAATLGPAKAVAAGSAIKPSKPLPAPNSDFYRLVDFLTPPDEIAIVNKVQAYIESKVQPIINKF